MQKPVSKAQKRLECHPIKRVPYGNPPASAFRRSDSPELFTANMPAVLNQTFYQKSVMSR